MAESRTQAPAQDIQEIRAGSATGWLRWLSRLLVVAGFAWIVLLLRGEWPSLAGQLTRQSGAWLGVSLLVGSVAVLHDAFIFYALFDRHSRQKVGFLYVARLLFVGQLIRHVPGRFWGVVYQMNEARMHLPPLVVLSINLDFMFVSLAHSLLIPAAMFVLYAGKPWLALFLIILGLGGVGLALRFNWINAFLASLPARVSRAAGHVGESRDHSWADIFLVILLVLSHWIFYLLAWQLLPRIMPQLEGATMTLLCVAYSLAWAVGFVSMITPAGLGVREAAFVLFSAVLATPANLALLAVFVRVWLLFVDMILFLAFAVIKRIRPGK